jgi:uncharacterized protein (TIGR03435 family)
VRYLTTKIEGLPDWANSERYTIEAKAQGNPGQPMMNGPMMQALLEERFRLKVHAETREGKIYILSVGKDGPKMDRLQPGGCTPADFLSYPRPANPCPSNSPKPGNLGLDAWTTMDSLAENLNFDTAIRGSGLDYPVINQTGLTGAYHVQLEYSKRDAPAPQATDAIPAPSVFTAIQKLGLKLEAGTGPRQYLVFTHAERPPEN